MTIACLLVGLIGAPVGARAASSTPPPSDAQVWSELDVIVPLTSHISVTGLALIRAADALPNPSVAAGGGALDVEIGHGWALSAGDFSLRVRSASSGRGLDLQLPLAAATYSFKFAGFALADRNRAEDVLGAPGVSWRYRNRMLVSRSVPWGPIRSVFASDETFFDVDRNRWSRNRAQLGVGLKPFGPTQLQIYYLRQDDAFARPGRLHILGLDYILVLK